MSDRIDFAVHSPDDKVQLFVEAKARPDANDKWAAHMRKNILAHMTVPSSPFFILASLDRFYLWKDFQTVGTLPPDYQIDTKDILAPYAKFMKSPLHELSEQSFELVVRTWLEDLVNATQSVPAQQWLVKSGLYASVKDGHVKSGP